MELRKNANIERELLKHFQNIYGAVQKKSLSLLTR